MFENQTQFGLAELESARLLSNYKIVTNKVNNRICYVFLSSNGLYYPNDKYNLKRTIDNDYYEWESYGWRNVKKIIYIRDIYKQWYIKGINNTLDSIDKVVDFIKSEVEGYDVTFIGSSAGGYFAHILSFFISNSKAITFSAQYDLVNEKKRIVENKMLADYDGRYLNISNFVLNSRVMYSLGCKQDVLQIKNLLSRNQSFNQVSFMGVYSDVHGVAIPKYTLKKYIKSSRLLIIPNTKLKLFLFIILYSDLIDCSKYFYKKILLKIFK